MTYESITTSVVFDKKKINIASPCPTFNIRQWRHPIEQNQEVLLLLHLCSVVKAWTQTPDHFLLFYYSGDDTDAHEHHYRTIRVGRTGCQAQFVVLAFVSEGEHDVQAQCSVSCHSQTLKRVRQALPMLLLWSSFLTCLLHYREKRIMLSLMVFLFHYLKRHCTCSFYFYLACGAKNSDPKKGNRNSRSQ